MADSQAGVGGQRPGGGLAHRRGHVRCEWRLCCVNADVAVRNVLLSAGLGMGSCVHGAERAREGSWRAARGRVGCVLWCGMALARRRAGAGLPRGGLRASCAVGLRNFRNLKQKEIKRAGIWKRILYARREEAVRRQDKRRSYLSVALLSARTHTKREPEAGAKKHTVVSTQVKL